MNISTDLSLDTAPPLSLTSRGPFTIHLMSHIYRLLFIVLCSPFMVSHAMASAATPQQNEDPETTLPPFQCSWVLPKYPLQIGVASDLQLYVNRVVQRSQLPSFPESPNTKWKWGSLHSSTSSNGHVGQLIHLQVTSLKSGPLELPQMQWKDMSLGAAGLHGDSTHDLEKTPTTPALTLQVKEAKESPDMTWTIEGPQGELYPGEGFVLNITWTTRLSLSQIKALNFDLPILRDQRFRHHALATHHPKGKSNEIGLPMGSQRIIGHWKRVMWKDSPAHTITFQLILSALESGSFTFPDAFIYCSIPQKTPILDKKRKWKGMTYPSYFNNNFFQGKEERQKLVRIFSASQEKLKLKVRPLPSIGRPKDFSGFIGKPKMELTPMQQQLVEGEVFELHLSMESDTILPAPAPKLSQHPAYAHNFTWGQDEALPLSLGKSRLYRFKLTPIHAELEVIPALVLHCFDPESESYISVRSNSPEIQVLPSQQFDQTQQKLSQWFSSQEPIIDDEEGIWGDQWGAPIKKYSGKSQEWIHLFLFLLAPFSFLGLWLNTLWKRRVLKRAHPLALEQCLNTLKAWSPKLDSVEHQQLHLDILAALRHYGLPLHPDNRTHAMHKNIYEWTAYLSRETSTKTNDHPKLPSTPQELSRCLMKLHHQHLKSVHSRNDTLGYQSAPLSAMFFLMSSLFFVMESPYDAHADTQNPDLESEFAALSALSHRTTLLEPHRGVEMHRQLALRLEGQWLNQQEKHRAFKDPQTHGRWAYNIANHWFHAEELGFAILWYQRAQNIYPKLPHLKHNLNVARQKRVDQLPPQFQIFQWSGQLSPYKLSIQWMFVLFHLFFFYRLGQWFFYKKGETGTVAFLCFFWILSLAIVVTLEIERQVNQPDAVITTASATARKGPSPIFSPAFTTPLHAGTEVKILEQKDRWSLIELSDLRTAWVPNRNFVKLTVKD